MNIDNRVAVFGVLSDDELINTALDNDEDDNDNKSNAEEMPLRPTVAEASAVRLVLEDFVSSKMLAVCPIWSI